MTQFTQLLFSGDFAAGMVYYEDHYPGQERTARIVVPVMVEEYLPVQAVLDTGAPWCILSPEIAEQVGITAGTGYEPSGRVLHRGQWYKGKLFRMRIGLEAEQGESLDIEATVFVPTLPPGETWLHPNFIGLDGFLNRIRFAIDPDENAFYFGPV